MEHTVLAEIGTLVAIFAALCGIMSKWISGLAENTQSMKDLRGEFEKWDKRNDNSHAELKTEISKNREEVNAALADDQRQIDANRHDIENHEARLQCIEKNKA